MTGDRILRVLRTGGVMTASELMTVTGLSRTAIHDVCGDLLRLGWIDEVWPEESPARPGRPPRQYRFAGQVGAVVGVDFGVHTVLVTVADLRGNVTGEAQRRLDDPGGVDRWALLDELVNDALRAADVAGETVQVVAVGVPMAMSSNATIHYPDYQRVIEISRHWADAHGWPVLVENDANLAALGERRSGVAQGVDNVIVLLASERLGAGIIAGGTLVRGEHASAGELRFVNLMPEIQPEYLGVALHTRQLAEAALEHGHATPGLRAIAAEHGGRPTAPAVFRAAEAGDESALVIVNTVCGRLARLVGVLATLLDPALVVISGGIAEAGEMLASTTEKLLPTWMIDNPPRVAVSTLGPNAVAAGAITLALDHLDTHVLDDMDR